MDNLSKDKRSRLMSKVRSRGNLTTELRVVEIFRKNKIKGWRRHLPLFGRPDFTFPKDKLALFVDGCFWHGCPCCYCAPQSSAAFWEKKLSGNRARDRAVNRRLRSQGWKVKRVWECQLKTPEKLLKHLADLSIKAGDLLPPYSKHKSIY